MPTHVAWNSIELLHNAIRTLNYLKDRDGTPLPVVAYRGKVKLHGTNCAVQITTRGGVYAQSRTKMLVDGADYKGFSREVEAHKGFWKALKCPEHTTVFGEWCGPGVEKGMAISGLDRKVFAVFAIQYGEGEGAFITYEPSAIQAVLDKAGKHPNVYVLPWYGEPLTVNYGSPEDLELAANTINTMVKAVEGEDPWVKDTFGVSGMGEGIVFYPVGEHYKMDPDALALLMFKAKGDKHRTAGTKEAAQVAPEVVNSTQAFVDLMVTEARLNQGLSEACNGEAHMRHTRAFLAWVAADVQKESVAELEASGLTWKQVQKAVQAATRDWLKTKSSLG